MDKSEVKRLLEAGLGESDIRLQSDGNKLLVIITSPAFEGKNRVQRQQMVYRLLNDKIGSGEIHAVSMKCLAPGEGE